MHPRKADEEYEERQIQFGDPMEEQKKKNDPISIERGKELDEEIEEAAWNNLSLRVHLFNEKYIKFLCHFESPKAEKEWRDLFIQNPEREACP